VISDRQQPRSTVGRKSHTHKAPVAIAVETLQPKGFGRVRMQRIAYGNAQHLVPFVQEAVEPGAQVHTDGSAAYRSLRALGYHLEQTVMLGSDLPAHVPMPGVHPRGGADQTMDSRNASWRGAARAPGRVSG
jgi:ISXO2-like transposase domain